MIPTYKDHSVSVVYKITNEHNDKIYVGSSRNLYRRYRRYLIDGRPTSTSNSLIHRAMRKHGIANFSFEILEHVPDISDLIRREQHWIDTLQPFDPIGYNVNPTAGSWQGQRHTDESRTKMSKAQSQRETTNEQLELLERIRPLAAEKNRQELSEPVHQLDVGSCAIVATHPSMAIAAQNVGVWESSIVRACSGKQRTAGGYYWVKCSVYDACGFVPQRKRRRLGKAFYLAIRPIYQLDAQGNHVRTWGSASEAQRALQIDRRHICSCLAGKAKTYGGYQWAYVEDPTEIDVCKQRLAEEYARLVA